MEVTARILPFEDCCSLNFRLENATDLYANLYNALYGIVVQYIGPLSSHLSSTMKCTS